MAQAASFSLDASGRGPAILTLDGEFGISDGPRFTQWMGNALDSGATGVVIDLRGVTFLHSTMLRALMRGLRRAEERNGLGSLNLVRPNPVLWRVFVLTGMSEAFSGFRTLREASAAL
jgi:anti-anti-sigma factor